MKGYKQLSPAQRQQVLDLYAERLSTVMVAQEMGVTIRQVWHVLHRNGIALSGAQNGACYRNLELVRQMAADGAALAEIARRIGTKHQTVAKFLTQYSIPHTRFRQAGENNPAWKGGRMTDKDGYVLLHQPDHPQADRHGYVREHRLVMERELGRYLLRTEVVDHIDGHKAHNDPSNLRLFASNKEHLAATLRGRTPQWTEAGKDRLRESFDRGLGARNRANQVASASDDRRLPGMTDPMPV